MMSARSEAAAKRFFEKLAPLESWDFTHSPSPIVTNDAVFAATELIAAAFLLREQGYRGSDHDIRRWQWPFDELDRGGTFDGDEPWTILLKRAVEILGARP
jgi:hypothetical protein